MNKKLMKRVIMDVQNEGCPEAHIPALLDCFENLMATAASASCRRAYCLVRGWLKTLAFRRREE